MARLKFDSSKPELGGLDGLVNVKPRNIIVFASVRARLSGLNQAVSISDT